jgi:hypothetical protein
MRNEGPFIVEWVTWYRMLGFTDIVVVSNDCTDRSPELLDALASAGWLHHIRCDVPDGQSITPRKLKAAQAHPAVRDADWLMIADVDEFLVIHCGAGLIGDLLAVADDPAILGLSINWKVYGTSGRKEFADAPVHQQFVYASTRDHGSSNSIKSIFRHSDWFQTLGEHGPKGLLPEYAAQPMRWITAAGKVVADWNPDGPYMRATPKALTSHKVAQINHYMLRSEETFSLKYRTLSPVALRNRYTRWYFKRANSGEEMDASAFRYADAFAAMQGQAMALPDVARLHHLCCADHIGLICDKAGKRAADDPRYQDHLAAAEALAPAAG